MASWRARRWWPTVVSPLSLGVLLLLTGPVALAAQHRASLVAGPSPSALRIRPDVRWAMEQPVARDTVARDIQPTHWKEGALVGGVSLGLGMALLWNALCRSSDTIRSCGGYTVGGFLVGGLIGGIAGALIGGQFPKDTTP